MISHSKPFFDKNDKKALLEVLKRQYASHGDSAKTFAYQCASLMHKKWGIAVQSGTDALILAINILDLKKNAKIAIPAYACGAILDAVAFHRFIPVPIDISKDTLAVNPELASDSSYDAVIAAHLFGIAAPLDKITNKNLIEDCAQCIGLSSQGKKVGSIGKFSISSFYATKILCTGHGGILCGNDQKSYQNAMKFLTHDKIHKWQAHLHFLMSDLNASLGLSQLKKLDQFIKKRRAIAAKYWEALSSSSPLPSNNAFFRFLVIPSNGISRDTLAAKFAKAGIETAKPVFNPIYRLLKKSPKDFPNSEWAYKNLISIPIYPALSNYEIEKIREFLGKHKNEMRCWPSA